MRSSDFSFLDRVFDNELSICVSGAAKAYEDMLFTDALRCVFYDLENLRSQYAILSNNDVHGAVIERLLELQAITLCPIAPHFAEHLWRNILKKDTLVVQQKWPEVEVDGKLARQYALIQGSLRSFRLALEKFKQPKKKSKEKPAKPTQGTIFVAKSYQAWQVEVLKVLQGVELNEKNEPLEKNFMSRLRETESIQQFDKQVMKQAMPFASFVMSKEVKVRGTEALELELPFDEDGISSTSWTFLHLLS